MGTCAISLCRMRNALPIRVSSRASLSRASRKFLSDAALVPVFGPIIGAIPAIAAGFVEPQQKALAVLIAFIIIQQLEASSASTPIAVPLVGAKCSTPSR